MKTGESGGKRRQHGWLKLSQMYNSLRTSGRIEHPATVNQIKRDNGPEGLERSTENID